MPTVGELIEKRYGGLEKFGGDSIVETRRNFLGYREQLRNF